MRVFRVSVFVCQIMVVGLLSCEALQPAPVSTRPDEVSVSPAAKNARGPGSATGQSAGQLVGGGLADEVAGGGHEESCPARPVVPEGPVAL